MRVLGHITHSDINKKANIQKAGGLFYIRSIIKLIIIASIAYLAGANLAQAARPSKLNSNACISHLQKQETADKSPAPEQTGHDGVIQTKTPELLLISKIIEYHFKAEGINHTNVPFAHETFVNIIDPFHFILTEAEVNNFKNIDPKMANDLVINTFIHGKRDHYLIMTEEVTSRLSQLVEAFSNDKSLRDQVKSLAAQLMQEPVQEPAQGPAQESTNKSIEKTDKSDSQRPKSVEEILPAFTKFLAVTVANIANIEDAKSPAETLKMDLDSAFLIMMRELRPLFINHLMRINIQNLPYLIVKSYAKTLDPHTDLFLPDELESFTAHMSGNFIGIGIGLKPHIQGVEILNIMEDSPAEKHGLLKGDVITHIKLTPNDVLAPQYEFIKSLSKNNWVNTRALSYRELIGLVKGKEDSNLSLKVERKGKTVELNIIRKAISKDEQLIHTEIRHTSEGPVAYIELNSFYFESATQLRAKILELKQKENIKAIVLSLRGNGGGSVDEFAEILGFFVPKGLAIYFHGKQKNRGVNIPKKFKPIWDGPLVIMTDSTSASASEALAQSLKDYKRAIVIGDTTTHGKGSMQTTHGIGNFAIKVTEALYYTASGLSPQFRGVKSDIILPYSETQRYEYERELPGAIKPEPLDLKIPEEILNQVAVPQLDKIKFDLTDLSRQRNSQIDPSKKELTDKEKYDLNTAEGLKITEDFIRLIGGIK